MASTSISDIGTRDCLWSPEFDCIPLKKRLKLLHSSKPLVDCGDVDSGQESSTPPIHIVVKKDDQQSGSQGSVPVCFIQEEWNDRLSAEQNHMDMLSECICQGTEVKEHLGSDGCKVNDINDGAALAEKVDSGAITSPQSSTLSKYPVKVGVCNADNNLTSSLGIGVEGSLCIKAVKRKAENTDCCVDDLDHIVLKERRRMLLSRIFLEFTKPVLKQGDCPWLPNSLEEDTIKHSVGICEEENHLGDPGSLVAGCPTQEFLKRNAYGSSNGVIAGNLCTTPQCSSLIGPSKGIEPAKRRKCKGNEEIDRICSSKKASATYESCGVQDLSGNPHIKLSLGSQSASVNMKAEPLDYSDGSSLNKSTVFNVPSPSLALVKSKPKTAEESYADEVDHMLLGDRIKLLASREVLNLDNSRNDECSRKFVPSIYCSPIVSESAEPLRVCRPRKRRKTATDSVETALEEDAPGLLQVLINQGVTINEMKLYGEKESDELIDEESFSELEAVISKLFSERQSILKFAPLRCTKGEKASYCLACLISLVEQARYLKFRNWPAEWGWCRDLQSFIFVFERHNRIVLERPEYGYATYFFELVDSLPIDWQIKRLVTAMKLSTCSRASLIENKSLLVGEDLSEGEARVLMEYGWVPNSGLGTMLNYRDRVVHDRKHEKDSSDWRSKIGKLLTEGYNGGTIVLTNVPKKAMEYTGVQVPQIKLEPT